MAAAKGERNTSSTLAEGSGAAGKPVAESRAA
jgi:hypothetical protein